MSRGAGSALSKGITRRLLAWLGVVVIGGSAFLFGAIDEGPPRTDADRVYSLAQNFGCPVCDGQSVAESDTVVARNIRQQIAGRVDEGRNDETIIAELEAAFPGNDYTPAASGLSSLVWILPVVAGAGALAGLVVVFRRWRREIDAGATPADERLVAEFLNETDTTSAETDGEATDGSTDPIPPDPIPPDPIPPDPIPPDPIPPDPIPPDPIPPDLVQSEPVPPDLVQSDPVPPDLVQPDPVPPDLLQPDPVQPDPVLPEPTQPDERGDG